MKQVEKVANSFSMVLFMHGSPSAPTSRTSAQAAEILGRMGANYKFVDIQADPVIRAFLPKFSGSPVLPQLFVRGEFLGGAEVMAELAEQGELQKIAAECSPPAAKAS